MLPRDVARLHVRVVVLRRCAVITVWLNWLSSHSNLGLYVNRLGCHDDWVGVVNGGACVTSADYSPANQGARNEGSKAVTVAPVESPAVATVIPAPKAVRKAIAGCQKTQSCHSEDKKFFHDVSPFKIEGG